MITWPVVATGLVVGAVGGVAARRAATRYGHDPTAAAITDPAVAARHRPLWSGLAAWPFVVAGGVLCGLLGVVRSFPEVLACWWLVVVGLALGYVDATTHRLPNPLCLAGYLGVVASVTLSEVARHDPASLLRALLGGLVLAAVFLALALATSLGVGDAKLAASLGTALAWTSWPTLFTGTLTAFCLAALPATLSLLHHPRGPRDEIAFGPYLLAGTILTLLLTA